MVQCNAPGYLGPDVAAESFKVVKRQEPDPFGIIPLCGEATYDRSSSSKGQLPACVPGGEVWEADDCLLSNTEHLFYYQFGVADLGESL